MDARSSLVAAALKLLEESGESGFSTRAACAIAGVTAPTLYHHFGTADGLLSAAIEAAFAAFLRSKQNQAGERDPIRALKGGWDDYVAFAAARPRLYAAMFARVLQGADIPAARQSRGILEDRLARIDGLGRLALPVAAAADIAWASAHAAAVLFVASPGAPPSPRTIAALREAAMSIVLKPAKKG